VSAQSVPNALGPVLDRLPEAVPPATFPATEDDAPVFSVAEAEKPPEITGAVPRAIMLVWLWPSAQIACQPNWMEWTAVGVTLKEIGRPWLVLPT
jgi:hypothetical protein